MISHALSQQVSDLKRQLAEQTSECDAIRAECEEWKARANRESQEKAMLEELLKDSEKGKIEWWTKFKELQAVGSGAGLLRKRKRAKNSEEDDEADPDVVPASEESENSLDGLSEAIRDDDDSYEETAQGAGHGVQTMNTEALPTPPSELVKSEEEEVHLASENPARVKVEEREDNDDKEIEYLSGTLPTTLGDIKIKIEPGVESLPPDSVQARLRQSNAQSLGIELDTEFHAKAVTRDFLSSKYGGNPNATWCHIPEATRRRKGHDIPIYFCPNISRSPNLPRAPGLPGLFNIPRAGMEIEEMPMIVGLNVNKWVYMGHYVGVPQDPLSQEEIESLGEKTLSTWVEDMVKKKKWAQIRARVYLRLRGMEPTDEAVERILNSRVLQQISATDIRTAFERREEVMHVVCLKPVRYDRNFQKEIIDGFRKHEREMKTKQAIKKEVAQARSADQPMGQGKRSRKSSDYPKQVPSAVAAPNAANTKIRTNRGEQNDPVEDNWELRRPKRARQHSPEV